MQKTAQAMLLAGLAGSHSGESIRNSLKGKAYNALVGTPFKFIRKEINKGIKHFLPQKHVAPPRSVRVPPKFMLGGPSYQRSARRAGFTYGARPIKQADWAAPGTIQDLIDKGNKYLYKNMGSRGRDMLVNGLAGAGVGIGANALLNAVTPDTETINTPYGKVKRRRSSRGTGAYLRAALAGGAVGAGFGAYKNSIGM